MYMYRGDTPLEKEYESFPLNCCLKIQAEKKDGDHVSINLFLFSDNQF